jgi:hypothetical protein
MKRIARHTGLRVFAILAALPIVLLASAAWAESPQGAMQREGANPFTAAITPEELSGLRGGTALTATLPAVRLWDEVGGRGPARTATTGPALSVSGGTLTIRVGGR